LTPAVAPSRGLLAKFFAWSFRMVAFSPESEARLQTAAQHGPVVYVMRTSSFLGALLMAAVVRASKLPQLGYVSHLNVVWWQSIGAIFRGLRPGLLALVGRYNEEAELAWLQETLARGDSALLFLFRPRHVATGRVARGERALARLCEVKIDKPIQVVPLSLFYDQARETAMSLRAIAAQHEVASEPAIRILRERLQVSVRDRRGRAALEPLEIEVAPLAVDDAYGCE
jgi:hypothetical protein